MKEWTIIVLLSLLLFFSDISSAGTQIHGAKSAGMGTAFVAIADDPSAISSNPAGLAGLKGTNLYMGATAVVLSSKYKSPTGESQDTEFQVFIPPHLYVSSDFGMESKVFGLGVFSPFGIGGRKWSESGLTRYAATESLITTLAVNPTFAWQIKPRLSIGLGAFYLHAINEAEKMVDQSLMGAGDAKSSLELDGGGWGYNLGILFTPSEKFGFGLAYRSGVKVDQNGTVFLENIAPVLQPLFGGSQFETGAHADLEFPQIVSLGIAYRPIRGLTLGFDVEWIGWSSFERQDLNLENEVPGAGFSDSSTDLGWRDIWSIKVGTEYKVSEKLALRAGYAYSENPVPEHTLSPGNPDSDQHNLSIGFGYQIKKWVVDTFYMATFFKDRKVNNSILSGEYENFGHFIGLSIGYKF